MPYRCCRRRSTSTSRARASTSLLQMPSLPACPGFRPSAIVSCVSAVTENRQCATSSRSAGAAGCMSMTPIYGVPDPEEAIATLHLAPDLGIDFIDTSDAYGANAANEELVGQALKGRRQHYVLATKFGNIRLADGKPSANGKPEYV